MRQPHYIIFLLLFAISCQETPIPPQEQRTAFEDTQAGNSVVEILRTHQDATFKQRTARDLTTDAIQYQTTERHYLTPTQDSAWSYTAYAWKTEQPKNAHRYSLTLEQQQKLIPGSKLQSYVAPYFNRAQLQINLDAPTAVETTQAQEHLKQIAQVIFQLYQERFLLKREKEWLTNSNERAAIIVGQLPRTNDGPSLAYNFVQTQQLSNGTEVLFWSNRRNDFPAEGPTHWIQGTDTLAVDWQAQFERSSTNPLSPADLMN